MPKAVARHRRHRARLLRAGRLPAPMDEAAALEVAVRLKALADPARVRLMSLLLSRGGGLHVRPRAGGRAHRRHGQPPPRPAERAGLVEGERRGMNVYYRARREALGALVRVLDPDCC